LGGKDSFISQMLWWDALPDMLNEERAENKKATPYEVAF
jgi:hypothetical protein